MGFLSNSRGSTVPATRQMNSFGHAININTLVAAAENQKQGGIGLVLFSGFKQWDFN